MTEEELEFEEEEEEPCGVISEEDEVPSLLGLCGEINEESAQEMSLGLISANHSKILDVDPADFEDAEDLEFFISSNGGSMMIQALADNSRLSVGEIYNIFSKNTDEYFSADEALEMGFVDAII